MGRTTHSRTPWREEFRSLFGLAGADWRGHGQVKTTLNGARNRVTLAANFLQPDGTPVTLTVKARRDEAGAWFTDEEHLDIRLTVRRVAPA